MNNRYNNNNNLTPPPPLWLQSHPSHIQPSHQHLIPAMDPSFSHHFPLHPNLNNRDVLNLRWPPSALASSNGASHSPLQIIVLDNITRDIYLTPTRAIPQSPQRFINQVSTEASTTTRDESSLLTQEEQKDVLKKLRKEIYNPVPKKIIQRLNLYYRDNNVINNKGKALMNNEGADEDDKRCAICLEDFEAKQVVTLTPCNHMFHEECIVPWIKSNGKCPVCRFAIFERARESSFPSNNIEATTLTMNDHPLAAELLTYIRTMHEARGVSRRVPNLPIWF